MGSILAVIGPIHADAEAVALQRIHIRSATVFDASVGMEYASRRGCAFFERTSKRPGGELHGAICSQGPAQYLTGIEIHYRGKKALLSLYP